MQGLHLTADLYQCACDRRLLTDAERLAEFCRQLTLESGLTIVGEKWHTFPEFQGQPGGVTGMLLLMESHLAVHTWPERGGVTLDVYVCNFQTDNSSKAQRLMDGLVAGFQARMAQCERLFRGEASGPTAEGELLTEPMGLSAAHGFRFTRRLLERRTQYQTLELLESPQLGRCLRLDGVFMTSEADEFFYHETLIHPAATAHPSPHSALIIGGGDGGALEELLKHSTIQRAVLVELDQDVIDVARVHLQSIHRGAFDDPRVTLHIGDGAQYISSTEERFDLIFLDLTDPETIAGPLYTRDFFDRCRQRLTPNGALVLHMGLPFFENKKVSSLAATISETFAKIRGYGAFVPLYGGYWAMAVASDGLDPTALTADEVARRLAKRGICDLQYYSPYVHGALFALPPFHQKLLSSAAA